MLLTAQMGGEGAESSFRSGEETAPLLSEARAKSGRLCVCVCVCVYTTPSLPPAHPSLPALLGDAFQFTSPQRTAWQHSASAPAQPCPGWLGPASGSHCGHRIPSSALGALNGGERQSGSKWVCLHLSRETEPSAPLLLEQAPASPICCETLNSGPIASHLEPDLPHRQAPEMSRPERGSELWREG